MPNTINYTPAEIARFIEATGESDHIDAKGAMLWDGSSNSASLAKDIVAFANSRDGGAIVLGKSESSTGEFTLVGLSDVEASSFDTTKVGAWINNRFDPPVRLVCHRHEFRGKTFVVITVNEFKDVPHVCTKQFQDPENERKLLLREGAIYVRTENASSAPLSSTNQLTELIGLATRKRGRELLSMIEAVLRGKPILQHVDDQERFDKEFDTISKRLYIQAIMEEGGWLLRMHPTVFTAERWKTAAELETVLQRHSVQIRSEFPPNFRNAPMGEWGIFTDEAWVAWALARSWQFVWVGNHEDTKEIETQWGAVHGELEPKERYGGCIEFKSSIFRIIEMFMFTARLSEEFESSEGVRISLRATALDDCQLLSLDPRIRLFGSKRCRAPYFEFTTQISVPELRANWEQVRQAMQQFVEMFPGPRISFDTMIGWIQKFKNKEF